MYRLSTLASTTVTILNQARQLRQRLPPRTRWALEYDLLPPTHPLHKWIWSRTAKFAGQLSGLLQRLARGSFL